MTGPPTCPACNRAAIRDGFCLICGNQCEPQMHSTVLHGLRENLALLPAWIAGLGMLLASRRLWIPVAFTEYEGEQTMRSPAWLLIAVLLAGSLLFRLAPLLGPRLAIMTSSSLQVPFGQGTSAQEAFGTNFMRIAILVGIYLMVWVLFRDYA